MDFFGQLLYWPILLLLNVIFMHIAIPDFIFFPVNILPWGIYLLTADDQQIAISNPLRYSDLYIHICSWLLGVFTWQPCTHFKQNMAKH